MRLYHGSTVDISSIDLSLSKPNKDFGRAFYLSDDLQQAQEMAKIGRTSSMTIARSLKVGRSTTMTSFMVPLQTTE